MPWKARVDIIRPTASYTRHVETSIPWTSRGVPDDRDGLDQDAVYTVKIDNVALQRQKYLHSYVTICTVGAGRSRDPFHRNLRCTASTSRSGKSLVRPLLDRPIIKTYLLCADGWTCASSRPRIAIAPALRPLLRNSSGRRSSRGHFGRGGRPERSRR